MVGNNHIPTVKPGHARLHDARVFQLHLGATVHEGGEARVVWNFPACYFHSCIGAVSMEGEVLHLPRTCSFN